MTTTDTGPVVEAEATRLSTAPQPELPRVRGQRARPLRQAWRQLTSMRTALLLLFLLALAAVPGGFVPQRPVNPVEVQTYLREHPALGPLLDRLSLFDVFASPWFAAIYLLLFVSLVGCLVPRIRLHARALRTQPPRLPASLSRLPASDRWETDLSPEQARAATRRALGRSWRRVQRPEGLSAEKGYLRETGNLLFHVSLVTLLVGIAVGVLYGSKGTVLVKEGDGFANTALSYDDLKPGRQFTDGRFVPFDFTLQDFRATYGEDGRALTFDADVDWGTPGSRRGSYDMRVNHPLHVGGAKVYLIGHGYAPRITVTDAAGNVLTQTVPCLPQDAKFVSSCTVKVPNALAADGTPAQLGFEGVFTPTTVQDPKSGQVSSVFPALDNPALTLVGYRGDLGVDSGTPQSVYELNTDAMTPLDGPPQGLLPGQTWQLPGGGSLTYDSTAEWATFQVTQDPGKLVALVAAAGMVLGLLLSLFVRRRRLWVRVRPAGEDGAPGRTVVEVGGLARTDPEAFATEFADLVERLRGAAPAVPSPQDLTTTGVTPGG